MTYLGIFTGNCVPKGQMYDTDTNTLIDCNTTSYRFYYNTSRNNETYCFKSSLGCPDLYNGYNEETKECFNYIPPPTTILPPIPTTIPIIPTTIPLNPTTILLIPTTIPIISPTTISIMTTIPEALTNNQVKTTTSIYSATITEIIHTNSLEHENECKYGRLINYTSLYSNLSNEEVYYKIKANILSSYCISKSSVIIEGSNGYFFHLTNTINENRSLEKGFDDSAINLKECENILRNIHDIKNKSLIILKKLKNIGNGKNYTYKYEVFNPYSFEQLNLSVCVNTTIDIYPSYIR